MNDWKQHNYFFWGNDFSFKSSLHNTQRPDHDATKTARRIFIFAYHTNKRGHEVRSFSNIYQCASVFPVITPSNINAYRFSHCVFISFNYVQLIISILWNRWCPHFSNFLLGVHGIFSHLDLFVFTRWRVGPITLTRSDFTCLQWVQASPPWPQHSADVALCFLLQQDDKSCNSSVLFKITFICGTNDVFCRLLVALNRCSWRKAEKWILCSQRKVTLNK